jgi:hypothetical protein
MENFTEKREEEHAHGALFFRDGSGNVQRGLDQIRALSTAAHSGSSPSFAVSHSRGIE